MPKLENTAVKSATTHPESAEKYCQVIFLKKQQHSGFELEMH